MLPKELSEDFFIMGARGSGHARYSNFRRYTAVPPKPPPG